MKGSASICANCSTVIVKNGFDPYLCRWCEVDTKLSSKHSFGDI